MNKICQDCKRIWFFDRYCSGLPGERWTLGLCERERGLAKDRWVEESLKSMSGARRGWSKWYLDQQKEQKKEPDLAPRRTALERRACPFPDTCSKARNRTCDRANCDADTCINGFAFRWS